MFALEHRVGLELPQHPRRCAVEGVQRLDAERYRCLKDNEPVDELLRQHGAGDRGAAFDEQPRMPADRKRRKPSRRSGAAMMWTPASRNVFARSDAASVVT